MSPARHLRIAGSVESYPWERLPGETAKAFDSFNAYLDLGPRRSMRKVAESDRGSSSQRVLEDWSARFNWVARANASDNWRANERHLDENDQLDRMRRTHALVAQAAVAKAGERIRTIDPQRLTVREATALLELGVKIERLTRAQPTDITGRTDDVAAGVLASADIFNKLRDHPEIGQLADALRDVVDLQAEES
jgi:hypothetical protein